MVTDAASESRADFRRVRRAEEFFRERAKERVTVVEAAARAGCSVRALQIAFRRQPRRDADGGVAAHPAGGGTRRARLRRRPGIDPRDRRGVRLHQPQSLRANVQRGVRAVPCGNATAA